MLIDDTCNSLPIRLIHQIRPPAAPPALSLSHCAQSSITHHHLSSHFRLNLLFSHHHNKHDQLEAHTRR